MDLGKAKLLRTGLNTLHQAIHPVHGIAWTDGKQVCLTSLFFAKGDLKFGDTNVIGQFEHVLGLYWGPLCCSGSPALLAVQHKKHVTVWQLRLSSLEQNKLLCTQTCEVSEPFPLLSQGCIWHPRADVLAVLTKRDASVLFSMRTENRRVQAEIQSTGQIQCACWTRDGTRLVLAIGSALHSYIWNDIQRVLTACSFCPVFDVGGYIWAIDSMEEAQVVVTTDVSSSKANAGTVCDISTNSQPLQSQLLVRMPEDNWSLDSRRRSFDSERSITSGSVSVPPYGTLDMEHVLSKHRRSDPSPLFQMRRRDHLEGSSEDSSHLVLVTYERKVTTVRKVSIPGILVPDIMAFDASGCIVAVASNSCNIVLVYGIMAAAMPNMQQIQLQKTERPKGVCFLNDRSLLIMVGRQKSSDPGFLPSTTNTEKYVIRLVTKELIYNEDMRPVAAKNLGSVINSCSIRRKFSGEESTGMKEYAPLESSTFQSPKTLRKQSAEIKNGVPERSCSLSSQQGNSTLPITVENFDVDCMKQMTSPAAVDQLCKEAGRTQSTQLEGLDMLHFDTTSHRDSCLPKERAVDELSQNIEKLFARFSEFDQCLSEISDFAREQRKLTGNYPPPQDPPFINITCQKQLSENVFIDERRPVLLCENKLRLSMVRDLFNVSVVEMMHGPLWIALVEDAEGFVPLTFKPNSELTVRNGRRKMADSLPREAEVPSPSPPDSQGSDP